MEHFPLNMTDEEKNAYEMLLAFGQLTAGEMSQYNKVKLDDAKSLLESLLQKGFASKISNFGNHYFPKFPFLETHTHFKELVDRINILDKQSKDFFEERKTDLTFYQNSKNQEITNAVTDRITDFNKHSADLKQNIDNTLNEFDAELKKIEENFVNAINTKNEDFKSTEKGKIDSKRTNYDSTIADNQTKILSTVQGHKTELEGLSNTFTSTIQNFSLSYLDEVYDRLKALLDALREDLNNLSAQFDMEGKEWTKKSLDTQMFLYNDFSTVLDDNFKQFGDVLAGQDQTLQKMNIDEKLTPSEESALLNHTVTVNNNFIALKARVSEKLAEAKNSYDSEKDKVNNDIANFKKATEDKIATITTTYLTHLDTNTKTYTDTVKETVNTNRSDIESFTDKLNGEFQTLEKTRKDSLNAIAANMKKQQEIAIQTQKDATTHLQDGILTPFNTQYAEMKRNKDKFFNDTTKALDTHYKTIDTKMKEIIASFKTSYDGFTEKTQLKSDEAMKTANKEFDAFVKNEQQLLTSTMNDLKKPISGIQTNVDKQIGELDTKITAELETLNTAVSTHIENTKKSLDLIQKLFITDLQTDLTNLINTNNEEDPKVTKLVLLQKIKDNIRSKMDAVDKSLKNSSAELSSKVSEPFKKQLTDLTTRKTALVTYLNQTSTDHFTSVNKHLDDLGTNLNAKAEVLNTKVAKSIESSFTKLKGDYKNFIKEQYKITDDHFKEESKVMNTHKKEGIQIIKVINKTFSPEFKRLDTVVKTFTNSSFALLDSLDSVIITGIPDDLRDNIAKTVDELSKNSTSAQSQLTEFKTTWLTSAGTMETNLHSFNDTNKNQHTTEINNMKTESLKVLEEHSTSVIKFNEYSHGYGTNLVTVDHDDFQKVLVDSLNTTKSGLLDIVHEQQAILTKTIDKKNTDFTNHNNTIQERYKTISDTLDEFIGNFNNTTQERVSSREREITELHDETKNRVTTETNGSNEKHLAEIGTTITKHETDYKDHHGNLTTISHEFLALIENDSRAFADGVRDDGTERMKQNNALLTEKTNYIRTVHDHFASSVATANETATNLQNGLISSVGNHYNKLIEGNNGFTNDFQTTVTSGLDILTPKITIMEDFERIVNGYTYPKITALPVIGSSSALATIDHYLSDFKASVTLLIPNPNSIPVELIAKTKRPKRVTVASTFNLDNQREKEIARKLLEQDNVTVRQLEKSQTTESGYLQYLSADRDSEETFFGAYDSENKAEFAGMVSENRQYIEFIGRVITSDFMSRAKKIERV